MNANSTINHQNDKAPFDRTIVIGGSITGLTTARVLADYFAQVTVIEQDRLPNTPAFRRGTPQAHHAHLLLSQGQSILEQRFPGLLADLAAADATFIDADRELVELPDGTSYDDVTALACSRPLLENIIYRQIVTNPKVRIIQGYDVAGLQVDQHGQRVTGVRLRGRRGMRSIERFLSADLVADTSGRGSRTPQWLVSLGYAPPPETIVNAFSGYTSRIYRRPAGFAESWKMMRIKRTPPDELRGGMIVPLEGDRWHVTVVGVGCDYPPNDEAGFLAFARSLPSPQLFEAIKEAEPLTKPYSFRGTQNRLRHYDQLPRSLDGFLVCGDAVCAVSPVHAMGMTAAAIGSQTLADCLAKQVRRGDISGLARTFQQQLRQDIEPVWQKVTDSDRRWPATEVVEGMIPAKPARSRVITIPLPTTVGFGLAYR